MNEAETRAELIDPKLVASGWGRVENSKILREHPINKGRIQVGGTRGKRDIADYVLVYKNMKLGVIEAKAAGEPVTKGVTQAKEYAGKLHIDYTFSTNGREIYQISMKSGKEERIESFPTPEELWDATFSDQNEWQEKLNSIPFEDLSGTRPPYYYQEIAINKTLDAIAKEKQRILLTLATGTGKTNIAFQIVWKLFHARWNLKRDGKRRPRILFLADRNILADQAFNEFSAFPEDALVRINPLDIRKKGRVPTNGSIFFTIFQTFMSGPGGTPYFGEYPKDFFDLVIIDECHRGGANNEGNWRAILEHFSPAVQIGLTATPKRQDNVDTYKYFGEPVYIYSLKQGVNDGFLTPFKVKRIKTDLDEYVYTPDDDVIEGEVEEGKVYEEPDFNRIIEIKERESKRVDLMLKEINQNEKAIVFCATQDHALAVRDLINQKKNSTEPNYCVRVTADEGARGDEYLEAFKDNEKTIPTILTTSQKLSTGVDARNIRNIVLMRPINSLIEFKQIVGRGTRVFDGKEYFTILDFVGAYKHFSDPEWDGEPIDNTSERPGHMEGTAKGQVQNGAQHSDEADTARPRLKIKLRDGKEREIQHMVSTSFWSAEGRPISSQEFLEKLFEKLPEYFKNEDELRQIWSHPKTRKELLQKLEDSGIGVPELSSLQSLIDAGESDFYDVLSYVAFATKPVTRQDRVQKAKPKILKTLDPQTADFLEFVLSKYVEAGVLELDEERLPKLLNLKYSAISDAEVSLGGVQKIRKSFLGFQKDLYSDMKSRE